MVRPVRIVIVGLALFLVAAGAGLLAASQWGPERTRASLETALSERFGSPVTVGSARVFFGTGKLAWMKGVLLDASEIETAGNGGAVTVLSIGRLQAEIAPLSLLRGKVRVRNVALDGVRARLGQSEALPAVSAPPPGPIMRSAEALEEASATEEAAPPEPVVGFLEAVANQLETALVRPLRGQQVSLERSEFLLEAPPLGPGGPALVLRLKDVRGTLRSRRGGQAELSLEAKLDAGAEATALAFDLDRDRRGALAADLRLREWPLASAGPVLRSFLPTAEIDGLGQLAVRAARPQPGVFEITARLDAERVAGSLPRLGDAEPVPVDLETVRAGLDADIDPERLRIERAFVAAEQTELSASAEIARPLGLPSHTMARVGVDHYDLEQRRHLIALLPPRQLATVESVLEPLRSGRLEDVEVSGDATLGEWWRAFDDDIVGLLPETVEASARFAGFAVRAGEGNTLTDLSGRVAFRGDRLELRGVRGRRGGHWMPTLDATLDGVTNLGGNRGLREIPDDPNAPLMLGLGPMYQIVVDPNRPPGEMPGALLLDLDHVVHPTLLWPLRNLFARAIPGEDGIRILVEHGIWGRVPIRAEGIWAIQQSKGERKVERVSVKVGVKPAIAGLEPLDVADPVWARGRWHLDPHNLGDWRVLKSTGRFHAKGQNVRLVSYDLDLGIAGRGLGEGTIDFSKPDELPYWTTVRVEGAKAPGIVDKIGLEPHEATGDVVLDGDFRGEMRPGRRVIAGMEGRLLVEARDGAILRKLPVLLAVAKATDTFNPFRRRDEMRYSSIDAVLRIDRGTVHAEELRIDGPDVRLLATGTVDGVDPAHPVEAVVGVFFFKAIDRVIGVVPVLSDLILGEDDNLMGAYVEVTGPWRSPDASLVPLKTLATGPASMAVEGVPRFVRRAITAIQSAFESPADEGSTPDLSTPNVAAPPAPPTRGEDS